MTVQIDVELNEKWRDDIGELYTEFKSMDGASVDLDADISRASNKVGALRGEVEALTSADHELKVNADIDKDSIKESVKSLNDLDVDDVNLNLGDLSELDESIKLTSEIDEDDPLLSALRGDEDLEQKGTIRWSSRGGYGPSSSSGTIRWDSDVDTTDLIQSLEKAKKEAKAAGATEIDYEVKPKDGTSSQFIDSLKRNDNGSTNRTHRYTEYTNYESRIDHRSFEDAKEQLARLKGGIENDGLTEITTTVCVERCDDWKNNLNNIYKDLDALEKWNDENGEIEIKLAGNLDQIEETLDALEKSDFDPTTGGNDGNTEVEGMLANANSDDSMWDSIKRELGIEDGDGGGDGSSGNDRNGAPGWERDDRRWMGSGTEPGIVTETQGQRKRVTQAARSLGIKGVGGGDKIKPENIEVTTQMENDVIRDIFGDDVADSPAANIHRKDAKKVARKRAFADLVKEYDNTRGNTYSGRDYSDHGEFGFPDSEERRYVSGYDNPGVKDTVKSLFTGDPDVATADPIFDSYTAGTGDGIENVIDGEHGTNPFNRKEQELLRGLGIDTESSQFFDSDDDSGVASWYKSVSKRRTGPGGFGDFGANMDRYKRGGGSTNWGEVLGFGGLPGFGGDGESGSGGPGGMKSLKKLMPTMAKYWQLIATLSPMLITLAANAVGVAAAMGSVAVAGGAVIGLGLLGFGENLSESMKEAQKRMKEFKKEMYGAFQPALQQFSQFTEQFMATAPIRVKPIVDAMGGLTKFVDTFNAAFDGAIDWVARFIRTVTELEPILSKLSMRFGSILGDAIINAFRWFTEEAYRNQDVMISVGRVIMSVLSVLYKFAQVLTYLTAILAPFINTLAYIASFISSRWVAAFLAGAGAIYTIATAVGFLSGAFSTLMATSLASMKASIASFAATAITSFLAAAEALAVLIAGQATLLTMTGAGLALVAAGITAGAIAYKAIAPSGTPSNLGGNAGGTSGAMSGGGGGGMGSGGGMGGGGGGGSKTVINVEGDITKDSLPDVQDAIRTQNGITTERNDT